MRKCWKCSTTLKNNESICPACGAGQEVTDDLVNAAKSGNQDAMAQMYLMTCGVAYATIRSIVSTEEDAEDLLQDTYIQVFRKLDTLKEPKAFYGWVKTIARRQAINYVNEKKPIVFSQMESDDDEIKKKLEVKDEDPIIPDIVLEEKETTALLHEMLSDLKDEYRIPLIMRYYGKMSEKDIAEALNVTESTIKNRLYYARKKLNKKATEMEKRGISLRGLAPVSFLLLLLKNAETHASAASACEAVISAASGAAISSAVASSTTTSAAATNATKNIVKSTAKSNLGKAGKSAVKKGIHTLQGKIAAGAVAAAVVAGTSVAVINSTPTIDPMDYITVCYDGYSGDAIAYVSVDYAAFMEDMSNERFVQKNDINVDTMRVRLLETLRSSLSETSDLSNGDKIKYESYW